MKSWLIDKYSNTGKDRRQKEKGASSISNTMYMNLSKLQEIVKYRGAWSVAVHGVVKDVTQLSH